MAKYYITTPIYYINSSPHIGHSYTNIAADTIARFAKIFGYEPFFLTGTDEHGQKVQKAASLKGMSPQEFADTMVKQFEDLCRKLQCTNNDFIRTTQNRHVTFVQRVIEILNRKGDLYTAKYEGLYCTPCETFWLPVQLKEDNLCPDCLRPLEKISEDNYFFKISKYQAWLIDYIESRPEFIRPKIRRNEVLSFLKLNALTDLCISRPKERLNWGISFPFSPGHVTYVWFDALINYISAVGCFDENDRYHSDIWPADLQLIGKDILRQHAVYWPIMLKGLNIELPKCVFAHGWWMIGQDKMSKSIGNVINPFEMIDKYGLDVYRYFLLRDAAFGSDGSFSEEAIIKRYNSDLANDLGNLLYRTLNMVEKYFSGSVPHADTNGLADEVSRIIVEKKKTLLSRIHGCIGPLSDFNFSLALEYIWELVNITNKYIEETKPWNLAKEKKEARLELFIRLLIEVLRTVSEALAAFMPGTSRLMSRQIGEDRIQKGAPLFPRIEDKK